MNLATYFHVGPTLRISGAIPPFLHIPLWRVHGTDHAFVWVSSSCMSTLMKQKLIRQKKTIPFALQARRYHSRWNTSVKFIPLLIYWDIKMFLMPLQLNHDFLFSLISPAVFHAALLFFSRRHAFLHLADRKRATVCTRPQISTADNTVSLVLIPTADSQ